MIGRLLTGLLVALLVNMVVASIIWTACDDKEQRLKLWVDGAPRPFRTLIRHCWPLALYIRWEWRQARKQDEAGQG